MINSIKEWFAELWQGFVDWIIDILLFLLDWMRTLFLWLFEQFLDVTAFMFEQLAPPELAAVGLQGLFNALPPELIYFLGQSGISEGLSILGGAYTYRLLRKLFTLGLY